jgi:hypothetical protein
MDVQAVIPTLRSRSRAVIWKRIESLLLRGDGDWGKIPVWRIFFNRKREGVLVPPPFFRRT